jgi:hypothetical protein
MKLWTLIIFFVALNASGFMIGKLADPAVGVLMPINNMTMPYDASTAITNSTTSPFVLENFSTTKIIASIIGGIGIFALLVTRNAGFAVIATLLWVLGCMMDVTTWFLTGFSTFMEVMLAGTGLEWLAAVFYGFMLVFFFFFLASILSQRQDLT